MQEALLALLKADSGITARLGARINWGRRPQSDDTYPACLLQVVSQQPGYNFSAPDGYAQTRVQIDVWGETYGATTLAVRAIKSAISGYRGTQSGVRIGGIFIDGQRDLPDEEVDQNKRLFRVTLDALIWHSE